MSIGAVIFAQNNSEIDYTKMAIYSAEQVIKHLSIPVTIITDNVDYLNTQFPNHPFDMVIEIPFELSFQERKFYDGSLTVKKTSWRNQSRSMVYDLSPYDTTLVLDSDYIINSDTLKHALGRDYDFQIYRNSMDLSDWRSNYEFTRINQYSIPFYWATVFIFRKSLIMESFFTLVQYIKENWVYFKVLYNIDSHVFRNDFAFSIAIHIMNGKTNGEFATELPGTMIYIVDTDKLIAVSDNKMKFLLEKEDRIGEYIVAKTDGLDIHVMNKMSLTRCIDGVYDD